MNEITEKELRDAIADAMVTPAQGFNEGETTAPVAAKKHNVSVPRMRLLLSKLVEEKVMIRARVWFTDDWGDSRRIKGYKLKGD